MAVPRASERRLVLASASPRRRQLMAALDLPVESVGSSVDEGAPRPGETPEAFVVRVSAEKARQAASRIGRAIVLAADTSVVLAGEVLGKPADEAQATRMLEGLRGRTHTVVTGVTALDSGSGRILSAARSTDVTMREYSDRELAEYVASAEPLDKAGGYAVQDGSFRPAAAVLGCYLNVVGLPLCEVISLLQGFGVHAHLRRGWRLLCQCPSCPLEERGEVPEE